LNFGARWGGWSKPRPGPFIPRKYPAFIVQEAECARGPVWTGAQNSPPSGTRSPDRCCRKTSLAVVWHVKRHGLVESYRSFDGNRCFHVQGTRVSVHFVLPVVGSSFGLVVRQWAGDSKYRVLILSDNCRVSLPAHILLAEWAVILLQVTADTTMTCTFPVLSSNLRQMAPLVSDFFHSLRSKVTQPSVFLDACCMICLFHVQVEGAQSERVTSC